MECVLGTGDPGGAELAFVTHMEHRPAWIIPRVVLMADGPIASALSSTGIDVDLELLRSSGAVHAADFARRLARRLSTQRPDVVFAVGNRAASGAIPVACVRRIPSVWQKVDLVMSRSRTAVIGSLAARVVAVSRAAGNGVRSERVRISHPPVRLDEEFQVSQPRPDAVLTCVGRLEPTKGQHHLIAAAAKLKERFPVVEVLLAGLEPPHAVGYGASLVGLADRLGVHLELHPHVQDIEPLLERTTIYVQPSFRDSKGRGGEGLPMALVEASWAALPVVGTDIGGVREAVDEGVTGVLVPPSDANALAAAIETYLLDPELARAAGQAGADFARSRFRPQVVSTELFDLVAETAGR
jgi:glycosyltransferase involved in cell wall biosynthesis